MYVVNAWTQVIVDIIQYIVPIHNVIKKYTRPYSSR